MFIEMGIKVPVIECGDCNLKFVLLYAMQAGAPEDTQLLGQKSTYYCPYCGAKQAQQGREDA